MALVDCYNCFVNMKTECGMPDMGCLLCRTYGNGLGEIKSEYRHKSVEILDNGVLVKFVPPTYSCLLCKDTKVYEYQIYDPDLVDDSYSEPVLNTPHIKCACGACCNDQHQIDYAAAKAKYMASKK